jgi:hypothetical protein
MIKSKKLLLLTYQHSHFVFSRSLVAPEISYPKILCVFIRHQANISNIQNDQIIQHYTTLAAEAQTHLTISFPQLLIPYIHSYSLLLETISSNLNQRMHHAAVIRNTLNTG